MAPVGPGHITVVGLGPGGPDLVTAGTLERLRAAQAGGRLWLRTGRHPAAALVPDAPTFDRLYEQADRLEQVYAGIVEALVAAAADGPVTYAVPGSPVVAERTVELLVERAAGADGSGLEVELVPALSFLDLAWARLGIDPVALGVRVVDGQRFEVEAAGARGPLLVAQCDRRAVLSEVKLALDEVADPTQPLGVVVLRGLGTADEEIVEVPLAELDRQVDPDHLTSLYVPRLAAPVAGEVARLVELVATLRLECPWDREQTHHSLRRHLLEESYEVLEALDELDPDDPADDLEGLAHLEEELGDLLFQVAFHARLAGEEGAFTLADVARGVHDKLVARHPHVFGEGSSTTWTATTADQVVDNWEQIKKVEKGRASVFDGVPVALPALLYSAKIQKKATSIGLVSDATELPGADLGGAADRSEAADLDDVAFAEAVGEVLWAVVDRARRLGVDPEDALRATAGSRLADLRRAEAASADPDPT